MARKAFENAAELRAAVVAWQGLGRAAVVSTYGEMADWDVSKVTSMSRLFFGGLFFNEAIGSWDTSAVKDMRQMFYGAASFDKAIGTWNTAAVTDMSDMFSGAASFDQPIGTWNTAAVTNMSGMFQGALSFNEPIGTWDTSAVTDMSDMFSYAISFDQAIGTWDTSAVTDMSRMFLNARSFDKPIGSWKTSSLRSSSNMFGGDAAGQPPPCQAGREAGANLLMCERCPEGLYAAAGSRCQECPPGTVPSENRSTCEQCPSMQYSMSGSDTCFACDLPLLLVDNHCVWWPLLLLTLLVALAVGSILLCLWRRSGRGKKARRILDELYDQLWDEQPNAIAIYSRKLSGVGLDNLKIEHHISSMLAQQSLRAGVSMKYLLSAEFAELARKRTGADDPTFIDMKTAFWLSEDPIGRDVVCPRDGRAGCALVDWIPRSERREQTHFMSWTWKYSLQQVRSALEMFQQSNGTGSSPSDNVFFFMCFFVNNQYRLIVEESAKGTDNLEEVFEGNLKRIGRMVAILDRWDQPVYLSRVWTVYEQYVASTIEVQVQFVLPKDAADHLWRQIDGGSAGINQVIESLCHVDSEQAKAWKLEDEIKVKSLIQDTVGFEHVDMHVADVFITWIGNVVEQNCKQLFLQARAKKTLARSSTQRGAVMGCDSDDEHLIDSIAV